ncbi:MAG: DMT family transporter, partial [Firmicutes bacterium]|nr:DMT family transporter [Bacillota bacterium]
ALPIKRTDWLKLVVLGIVGVSLYQWFFTSALHDTLAANVAFLFDLSPLLTLLTQRLLKLHPATGRMFLGAVVSLAGVAFLVGASPQGSVRGDVYALIAALLWSTFTVLTDVFQVPVRGIALTGWMSLFGTLGLLPFVTWQPVWRMGPVTWMPLLYTIVFVTMMGLSLWQNAVMAAGAGKTSLYLFLIPLVAALTGWLVLGERLNLFEGLGAVLILGGVGLAEGVIGRKRPSGVASDSTSCQG